MKMIEDWHMAEIHHRILLRGTEHNNKNFFTADIARKKLNSVWKNKRGKGVELFVRVHKKIRSTWCV